MTLEILQIPARSDNYIYLLHHAGSGETAVVDPADAEPVLHVLTERRWRLTHILNTHHHGDHTGGNRVLKAITGCQVYGYGPDAARIPAIDSHLQDEDRVQIGDAQAEVLFIPGHTLGHIAYYFAAEKLLFCGDTLFSMGCGRLFEGTAAQMHHSLSRLAALPDDVLVYCGHEYSESNGNFALTLEPNNTALQKRMEEVRGLRTQGKPTVPTTLATEKATNPFLRTDSQEIRHNFAMPDASAEEVFAEIRQRKDVF